ncbi:MAG: Glu/Leu/Phe/Val dehydrogenase [Bacteroidetes bacterium]|nr:Glu/Leu/Phe/Val dehydrogenase [Bacteroidota bacterium]MDA1118958.1 Glu/Leu/Phe/Val dehydrogenase [Bacteroidota bacterium]
MISDTVIEGTRQLSVFDQVAEMEHEQVVFCYDQATGLKAIIAIHNTILGPSMGGTRMWNYATEDEAITDALRLSRGMTYKNAIAGLNIGGGKAVIIGDARRQKNEALMRRFGRFIESLGGRYVTAEDVNMTTRDMEYIRMETRHVAGISEAMGGSGDPSPVTAYGVYIGMKAARKKVTGSDSLTGAKVLVQGAGNVGLNLIDYLVKEGVLVSVSDIFEEKLSQISSKYKVDIVSSDDIFEADIDIYAPCALGATLNDESIRKMKCSIVAGGANNQLLDEVRHGRMLIERGIVYAPDFLINGGGITNIYYDYIGNYKKELVMKQVESIYETCLSVLNKSEKENITPQEAAMAIAADRIAAIGNNKLSF